MTPEEVIEGRRAERGRLLARARQYLDQIDSAVGVRAAVVVGSVARGDFNAWSDIDLIVVADGLPAHPLARLAALGPLPAALEVVAWTPAEWRSRRHRDPLVSEAYQEGVWLVGGPSDAEAAPR
jgi:uncharacterized protein